MTAIMTTYAEHSITFSGILTQRKYLLTFIEIKFHKFQMSMNKL